MAWNDLADAELEVPGVSSGQLDDDWDHITGTIRSDDDGLGRGESTSELVVSRHWRVPRVTANAALSAVCLPLSLRPSPAYSLFMRGDP